MKEVKIIIPDNCELIKEGDKYVVREKKNGPPRTWREFCDRYPLRAEEAYISEYCDIESILKDTVGLSRQSKCWKNCCTSKEEAEAFLALMQLRQLRKAWIGNWEQRAGKDCAIIKGTTNNRDIEVSFSSSGYMCMYAITFPTKEMAEDFLSCFKDLCETAKILL